jgi:hypothetical protein
LRKAKKLNLLSIQKPSKEEKMKNNIVLCVLAFVLVLAATGYSQYPTANPTYTMTLANDVKVAPNQYEFDVIIRHTGGGTPFECQGAQVGLLFNNKIKNGGTLSAVYIAGTSQMITAQIPANPSLVSVTGQPDSGVFRLAPKAALIPGEGTVITALGIRLGRFRISTSAASFSAEKADLRWNFLTTSGKYPSKISAWINDGTVEAIIAKDITVQSSHLDSLFNPILPVELSSFTADNQGRDVELNWETKSEINSASFVVERQNTNKNSWESIGSVLASGTSTVAHKYSYTDTKLNSGKYSYRLKMVDNDGTFKYSDVIETEIALPKNYAISQNYPNPFNPTTRIDYQLPFDSKVSIELYGITGEKVGTIINSELGAGYYTAEVDASVLNLASGVYVYRINAAGPNNQNFVQVKKLVLTK